jgi:large subunit ribosomal protein L31e
MADIKTEKKKEAVKDSKKLEDFKNTEENKAAISAESDVVTDTPKQAPSPTRKKDVAVDNSKKVVVAELEREYTVPLRSGFLKVPRYKRAKKAIKTLKEFLAKHMRVANRDLRKVKLDMYLNNEIWFRGIKKPLHKIKVKAVKHNGIVTATLVDVPEVVSFAIARETKRKVLMERAKTKKPEKIKEEPKEAVEVEKEDKNKDGVKDSVEEKEDKKAGTEKATSTEKAKVKAAKHTTKGAHSKKVMPVRKKLK